jgi:predicted Zn-dependent protease
MTHVSPTPKKKLVDKPARPVWLMLLLAGTMLITACARNPVTGNRQLVMMSEKQEIQLGAEYDPQVMATFGAYENEPLLAFIQEKGKEMGLISHRPELEYHFRILDSHVINAFAVPGGYIYLTRGILAHFNNEAELVGVLAHEMGHITARHSVSRQAKQQLGQLLLIGGMVAFEEFREYGAYAMQGMQLLFLKYSRDDERESDRLGVEYTAKIGYDSQKFGEFFQLLERMNLASEHGGIPTLLSTHPDPGDRHGTVTELAKVWKDSLGPQDWKVNTNSYLQMIDGMVYGEDPRQGYVEGNTFYHPELKFQFPFPRNWQLENSPMQVRMGPEDGNALMIFTFARGNSLDEATQGTLQQMELNVSASRRVTINGMPAVQTVSSQTTQNQNTGEQQTISVLSTFIDDGGTYYVFHGVSLLQNFENFRSDFESTMNRFAKLTDRSKIDVNPERIVVRRVDQSGSLANAFRSMGVPQDKLEEFSFLNNMQLSDRVEAGQYVKIVGGGRR